MAKKVYTIAVGGYATRTFLNVNLRIDYYPDYKFYVEQNYFRGLSLVILTYDDIPLIFEALDKIPKETDVHIYSSMQGKCSLNLVPKILLYLRKKRFRTYLKITPLPNEINHSALGEINIEIIDMNETGKSDKYKYDCALSFAGEERKFARDLADLLKLREFNVFYDEYQQSELWGKDLYQYLQDVYKKMSRFCVVFVSESYAKKLWTKHELKQAQARAFEEMNEYILPIRVDDTEIPGINPTTGYIDLRNKTIEQIAEFLAEKLSI